MPKIVINFNLFKRRIKIRYFILGLLFVIIGISVPGLLNILPNWVPIGSTFDTSNNGYSKVFSNLQNRGLSVEPFRSQYTELPNSMSQLLVILTPKHDFTQQQLDVLKYRYDNYYPTIIIGPTFKPNQNLISFIDSKVMISYDRIFDFSNNFNSPSYPFVIDSNGNMFVSVIPGSISYYNIYNNNLPNPNIHTLLTTLDSSESEQCMASPFYSEGQCMQKFNIAVKINNFIIVNDNWMLRNNVVTSYPGNINLLPELISDFNVNFNKILVDEIHLDWAPVNINGLIINYNNLLNNGGYFIFIILIGFVYPLFATLSTDLFKSGNNSKRSLFMKISKRLNQVHLNKVSAVPLSLEEKTLVNESISLKTNGVKYFSEIAKDYLNFISKTKIEDLIPKDKYIALQNMATEELSEEQCWLIIKNTNIILDKIYLLNNSNRKEIETSFNKRGI